MDTDDIYDSRAEKLMEREDILRTERKDREWEEFNSTSIAFRSRGEALEGLCLKVFGATPVFPDSVHNATPPADRPTPITDVPETLHAWRDYLESGLEEKLRDVAARMERQLAQTKSLLESSKRARQSLSDACDHLHRELAEAREQRDRLAVAVSLVIACQESNYGDATSLHLMMIPVADKLRAALAAVKGGEA